MPTRCRFTRIAKTQAGPLSLFRQFISMGIQIVDGDLLDQKVDVFVNSWNRNFIPYWLLLPQGVSGAIRRHGGRETLIVRFHKTAAL